MTFPLTLHVGPLQITAHAILEVAAYFIGFRYFLHLRKQQGDAIAANNRQWIILGAAFGAWLGAHLVGALEDPVGWAQSGHPFLHFFLSKTILGGLLGGLAGVELTKLIIGEKHSSGDLFTYPLILAMIIGRMGCLSMGVYEPTYGNPTHLPWAMDLGDSIYRHPTALYEIIFLGLLWLTLAGIENRFVLRSGARFQLFMMGYLLYRFTVDFIRPGFRWWEGGLTTLQLTALLGLIYYLRLTRLRFVDVKKTA